MEKVIVVTVWEGVGIAAWEGGISKLNPSRGSGRDQAREVWGGGVHPPLRSQEPDMVWT